MHVRVWVRECGGEAQCERVQCQHGRGRLTAVAIESSAAGSMRQALKTVNAQGRKFRPANLSEFKEKIAARK